MKYHPAMRTTSFIVIVASLLAVDPRLVRAGGA
jgi:hypothetical protein